MYIFTIISAAACDFLFFFFKTFKELSKMAKYTLYMFCFLQDYGKESQAKDVIEEYFKSKK